MVDDINQFTSWVTNIFIDENIIEIAFNGVGLNINNLPLPIAETERRFLTVIKNAGLKLFRGSDNFQTWTPIALTNNGNNVTEFPCPE